VLPFGKVEVSTVGLVSGGAAAEVSDAIAEGLDLYITGDADHTIHHQALEAGINVISGGHYATETWGVRLLADHVKRETGLLTVFLDLPTGL
jgi:putative NIF3 family GTP cyclohydrolase 1 type 2